MNIVWSIIIGFVVGLLAKFIMPGKDPGGFIVTALIGIGGALVANYLGRAMGWYGPDQAAGFVASIVGALLLLFLYRMVRPNRQSPVRH